MQVPIVRAGMASKIQVFARFRPQIVAEREEEAIDADERGKSLLFAMHPHGFSQVYAHRSQLQLLSEHGQKVCTVHRHTAATARRKG